MEYGEFDEYDDTQQNYDGYNDDDYDTDDEIKRIIAEVKHKKKKRREKALANQKKKFSVSEFFKDHSSFFIIKIATFLDLRSICALKSTCKIFKSRLELIWKPLLERDFPSLQPNETNSSTQISKALSCKYLMTYAKNRSEKSIDKKALDQWQFFNTLGEFIRDEEGGKTLYWKNVIEIIPRQDLVQNSLGQVALLSHDAIANIISVWVAEPLLYPRFRFEYPLKDENLVSCQAIAGLFFLTTWLDTEESSICTLYVLDADYKVNFSSQFRQKFLLKVHLEYQRVEEDEEGEGEVQQDPKDNDKPLISKPKRKENQISFEVFAKEPEVCSIQYHPEKKLIGFVERSSNTLIIGDLTTYTFQTFSELPLDGEITFKFLTLNPSFIISHDKEKIILWNTIKNCVIFEHSMSGIQECICVNSGSRDMVICHSLTTAEIINCETLEIIDKVTLPSTGNMKFHQLLKNEKLFCMVMLSYYDVYKIRFALFYCKLEDLNLQLVRGEPLRYIYPEVSGEAGDQQVSASMLSETRYKFSLSPNNTLVFFQSTSKACWLTLFDIVSEFFKLPVSYRWHKYREAEIKYTDGAIMLVVHKHQDYYLRRTMLVFPSVKFCYPKKCKRTIAVYGEDSEEEEDPWMYQQKNDKDQVPISIMKKKK